LRQQKTNEKEMHMLAETIQNTIILSNVKTGVAMAGASIGIGCATAGALVAMSRNPGMMGKILLWMFVGMALAEGWAVIAWFAVK
jgi:F-type H+-transporting ATPase subunit c